VANGKGSFTINFQWMQSNTEAFGTWWKFPPSFCKEAEICFTDITSLHLLHYLVSWTAVISSLHNNSSIEIINFFKVTWSYYTFNNLGHASI
jgi:hypothetical protein